MRHLSLNKLCFVLALLACLLPQARPLQAQTAATDPLSQQVLRALQQRGTGQTLDPGVSSGVVVESAPVYPQSLPAVPPNAIPPALPQTPGLSALERLMSLRTGQRLEQFGYDIFGHGRPVVMRQSGGLQDSYVLGEGDEIVVALHGQENANYRARVDRDGRVVLPNMPPLPASGRSFGAFRSDLERAVTRAFVGTEASVSVGTVRQIGVRVVGEVTLPGLYNLTGLSTAMDALNLAGGVKKSGSLRNIAIVRGGRTLKLDLYALLTGRAAAEDITLTDGDRIVVPLMAGAVAVAGQARRPGIYELPMGAPVIRTGELLALAGGPVVRGAYRFSLMTTGDDGRRRLQPAAPGSDLVVHDGDALFVTSGADIAEANVQLMGSTTSQGAFALEAAPSLHALLKAGMFAPQPGQPLPYLLMGAIIRLDQETMQRVVIPFSPIDAMAGRGDVALRSNDRVYILNVAEMRYIARRAADAALREAERGDNTSLPRSVQAPASTLGNSGANPSLSSDSLTNNPLMPRASLATDNAGQGRAGDQTFAQRSLRDARRDEAYPSDADAPRRPEPRGPYGLPDGEELPDLDGIPAPRDLMEDDDTEGRSADDGQAARSDGAGGQNRDEDYPDARDDDARGPVDRAGERRRPGLRLFVGLDDGERRLLIRTLSNYFVLISGEVNSPGPFLTMPQAGLDRIVQAAGGFTPNVDLSGVEVSSADIDNNSGLSRTVRHTYKLADGQLSQVSLKPQDQVRFNKVYSDSAGQMKIYGEVRYPGAYTITRSEHLSSVLARAGGLTEAAYPYGAIFLRRSVAEQERAVLQRQADALDGQLVALMSSVTANKLQISDAEIQYVNQMMLRMRESGGQGGRVAVQIDPKEIAKHPELDITLEAGDQLFIPRMPNSVVVAGEVMAPSGIQFREGRSIKDYLTLAGGTTEIADEDHAFVIQPDGSAIPAEGSSWLEDPPPLAPGSVIVVPRTLHPFAWEVLVQNVIQATSQLAITAASISVISK